MNRSAFRAIGGFGCAAMLILGGCGATDERDDSGGVTASEARALNEAAAMFDMRADNVTPALGSDNAVKAD